MTGLPFIPTSPEQRMALIAWGREREAQGMERAAVICEELGADFIEEIGRSEVCAAAIRAAIQQEPGAPAERSAKLEAFFSAVVDLTMHHDVLTLGDDEWAVVYPSDLGEALERVDPNWAAIRQQEPK